MLSKVGLGSNSLRYAEQPPLSDDDQDRLFDVMEMHGTKDFVIRL